jgi:anti-sigma factor RsiW
MCNKEQLVGYLYDELGAAERATFEVHLSDCADCRAEVAGLRQARQHLTTWAPPQPEFNFHIARGASAPGPVPVRRFGFVPEWAMAAAASLLLLAGAAAIANVELRYGPEGVVVRTGWGKPLPASELPAATAGTPTAVQAATAGVSSEQLKAVVQVLENRLIELERTRPAQTVKAAASMTAGITAPELRKILAESEARQREEMALQVSQVWKDFSAARVTDFTRLQDVVGRAQGLTNQQLRQHRESIESLYRVSASQQR